MEVVHHILQVFSGVFDQSAFADIRVIWPLLKLLSLVPIIIRILLLLSLVDLIIRVVINESGVSDDCMSAEVQGPESAFLLRYGPKMEAGIFADEVELVLEVGGQRVGITLCTGPCLNYLLRVE